MTSHKLNIHQWAAPHSSSPPWICLHGFLGTGADFDILADHWANHPMLLAPDLPGFGKSPSLESDPTTQQLCKSLLPLFESCTTRPVLLGYSMGARLALQCALAYPSLLAGLVIIGGTPGIEMESEREARRASDTEWINILKSQSLSSFLLKWKQQSVIRSQANIAPVYYEAMQNRRKQLEPEVLCNYLSAFGTGSMPDIWNRIHEIKLPTLLLTGEHDTKFTNIAQKMRPLLPQAIHSIIPDCGHAALFEAPDSVIESLKHFLPLKAGHP